jgi:putative spermidine/putrescine transport system ATP-binding protein
MAEVRVRNLTLEYGTTKALDGVSLDFPDGGFFGLLGPSGSGKTTLLRCIAGFVFPDSGTVMIAGQPVEHVPVEKREIGMMFQNYALFPNMNVAENVGFGLKVRKVASAELKRRVNEVLDLVQLVQQGDRRPHQLSGGQRQRVALARAIVTRPRVLLLDEPLSALDKALRVEMQIELKRIQREVGITTIFVTHDQEEALTLSDRIGILKDGRLVQEGTPRDLYSAPLDRFTASFLGEANFVIGSAEAAGLRIADGSILPRSPGKTLPGGPVTLAIRPESISLFAEVPAESAQNCLLKGRLQQIVFSGSTATCLVEALGMTFKVLVKASELSALPSSGEVWMSWPASAGMVVLESKD